jgi:hypothetical protein
MQLNRQSLLNQMPYLRSLFRILGRDVSVYSDASIIDAMLNVCPVVANDWPTNDQLELVFQRLQTQP